MNLSRPRSFFVRASGDAGVTRLLLDTPLKKPPDFFGFGVVLPAPIKWFYFGYPYLLVVTDAAILGYSAPPIIEADFFSFLIFVGGFKLIATDELKLLFRTFFSV